MAVVFKMLSIYQANKYDVQTFGILMIPKQSTSITGTLMCFPKHVLMSEERKQKQSQLNHSRYQIESIYLDNSLITNNEFMRHLQTTKSILFKTIPNPLGIRIIYANSIET